MFGQDAVRGSLTAQFREPARTGRRAGRRGDAERRVVDAAGGIAAVVGVVLLLIAALGVVVQLKDALNTIWDAPEPEGSGVWWYVRTYLISLAGVMALGFLLMVSLVVSTVLAAVSTWAGTAGSQALSGQAVNFAVSLGRADRPLRHAVQVVSRRARCAGATCGPGRWHRRVLFEAGKLAIAWYIGRQGLEFTYGAAASLVVLLIWVYYTAQIVLFGAEISHAYAHRYSATSGAVSVTGGAAR